MNCFGSGFITIINYGVYEQGAEENFVILTENNTNLTAENGSDLLIEAA